ncbi:DUF4377 domain-containing protein [Aestuariivivens sediminicola]|uniref:DUF4377 domain-containing protein n=1 Tax=Aestuariivivens sediminicola TaxID=2913560 RepID=UPI001F55C207|nr:DUF4377 domain-containing protein [Aestuariivivens sediminicola]
MKKLFLFIVSIVILSCSNDESAQEAILKVNHYKLTAIGLDKTLVLMVQENENIGTDNWSYIYDGIDGFVYEFGFEYQLKVIKKSLNNPPADGSSIVYELIDIISKTPTQDVTPFTLTLRSVSMINPPNFVYGDILNGFTLLDEIDIDCNDLCENLSNALANEDEVKGLFTHGENSLKLEEIIIE